MNAGIVSGGNFVSCHRLKKNYFKNVNLYGFGSMPLVTTNFIPRRFTFSFFLFVTGLFKTSETRKVFILIEGLFFSINVHGEIKQCQNNVDRKIEMGAH